MYIKFWGTRGSIPTALSTDALKRKFRKILEGAAGLDLSNAAVINSYIERLPFPLQGTMGGDTTCLEIQVGDQMLIIDAGSGLRPLGIDMMRRGFGQGQHHADFLFTHTHWDHIQGFPFFQPAFIPGNQFNMYSPFDDLHQRLEQQQIEQFFPVPMSYMSAQFDFRAVVPNQWNQIGQMRVYPLQLSHPGLTFGYRIEAGDSCLVLATDSEYQSLKPEATERYVEFFRNADMLIFDAQYTFTEVLDRLDWGHSTAMMGAELAHRANAKRLVLFHHDPTSSDEQIWEAKEQAEAYLTRRDYNGNYPCEVLVAYDGLAVDF